LCDLQICSLHLPEANFRLDIIVGRCLTYRHHLPLVDLPNVDLYPVQPSADGPTVCCERSHTAAAAIIGMSGSRVRQVAEGCIPSWHSTYPTASTRWGVVTTGGIDSNPVWKFNRFLAHQSANVGCSHRSRYQRCAILYLRRSLCRRLRHVSARVRSLVVESYLGCGRCWLNTPIWPSNLSLDRRALVAASVQSAPSDVLIRFRSMPDIPTKVSLSWGARWQWNFLGLRDPPTPQSPCYHSLVPTMGGCQALGPSRPLLGLRGGCGVILLKIFITNMNSKNSTTSSAPRQQNKRLCPGSDDSDTVTNTTSVVPRWLVIEAAEPDHSLSKLSPFALGRCSKPRLAR